MHIFGSLGFGLVFWGHCHHTTVIAIIIVGIIIISYIRTASA
jgi:hypothetical protein